jgi:lysophospholipase L1-like esterase
MLMTMKEISSVSCVAQHDLRASAAASGMHSCRRVHVVLLGDSIFDNAAYVGGGPDVVTQLRATLPPGGRATLLAVDGALIADAARQLSKLPEDTTHVVLSVGGNDALGHVDLLTRRARAGGEVLEWFDRAVEPFETRYRELHRTLRERCPAAAVRIACTIYNGNLDPSLQAAARAALRMFNDAITRVSRELGATVLELRDVCTEPAHYANPIEPSVRGGDRIARAIASACAQASR